MRVVKIGLLVTGKGEASFLPDFLRGLCTPESGGARCVFHVIGRVEQLSPLIKGSRKSLRMIGKGGGLPRRDEQIGLLARGFLTATPSGFVILVDDLEESRRPVASQVFQRYRSILDSMLGIAKARASVHFLVNMIEAYYFADPDAVRAVLKLELEPPEGDVEEIRHPKGLLKQSFHEFDEIEHGRLIARQINLERVLAHPERTRSLRSLVAWCSNALGRAPTDRYQLRSGLQYELTSQQTIAD